VRPPEIFGIVVRVIGLAVILFGLYYLVGAAHETLLLVLSMFGAEQNEDNFAVAYAFYAVAGLVAGSLLLWKADAVVRFVYREPRD
jgi:hypothetical protein